MPLNIAQAGSAQAATHIWNLSKNNVQDIIKLLRDTCDAKNTLHYKIVSERKQKSKKNLKNYLGNKLLDKNNLTKVEKN